MKTITIQTTVTTHIDVEDHEVEGMNLKEIQGILTKDPEYFGKLPPPSFIEADVVVSIEEA